GALGRRIGHLRAISDTGSPCRPRPHIHARGGSRGSRRHGRAELWIMAKHVRWRSKRAKSQSAIGQCTIPGNRRDAAEFLLSQPRLRALDSHAIHTERFCRSHKHLHLWCRKAEIRNCDRTGARGNERNHGATWTHVSEGEREYWSNCYPLAR